MANDDDTRNEAKKLSIEDRFEIVDALLACNCIYDIDGRKVVLQLLVSKFRKLTDAIPQTNITNRTSIAGLVSSCLEPENRGSLEELGRIVAYLEKETSTHAQRLRKLIHTRLVSSVIDLELFDELIKLTASLRVEVKDLEKIYLPSLPKDWVHELSNFKNTDEDRILSLMLRELAWENVQDDHSSSLNIYYTSVWICDY